MTASGSLALLIPAYNAAPYLPRLLKSALRQSEQFDEIWVYDDCSVDDTAAIATRYGARVLRGNVNRGCSHGKNMLASATSAEWVHFHDADDDLHGNFVTLAKRWIAAASHDVVVFAHEEIDDLTDQQLAVRQLDDVDLRRDPRSYSIRHEINSICGLYNRRRFLAAGGYDEDPRVLFNEDAAMHIQLAFAGLSFAAENGMAIINRRRSVSMSASNRLSCLQAQYNVMLKTAERIGAGQYADDISRRLWDIGACLAAELDWGTADKAIKLALRLSELRTVPDDGLFKQCCQISPLAAIRARELLIRLFKRNIRLGYPNMLSKRRNK
jgi:glycosyltransferase involved in cell wall biosynthesis